MATTTAFASIASGRLVNNTLARWLTYGSIILADVLGLTVAGAVALIARSLFHGQPFPAGYGTVLPSIMVVLSAFALSDLYPGVPACTIDEFRLAVRASSIGYAVLILAPLFIHETASFSRTFFLLAWCLTILIVPISRRLVRGFCATKSWWGIPTVIVGERVAAQMMLELLEGRRTVGLRPIAVLAERRADGSLAVSGPSDILWGDIRDTKLLAGEHRDCYAVLAMPNADSDEVKSVFHEYADHFRNVLIIPDLFGMRSLSVSAKDICGILALQVDQRLTFIIPQFTKRCFDLAIAITVAILVAPVFAMVSLAIFLSSPGPIFYGHSRIGKSGETFKLWKFRSMVVDAEAALQRHLAANPTLREEWERDHKLKQDPRVTWIGRILRKTSLDEIPQLWNVICGDMSLVGPRPIVNSEIARYGQIFRQYQRVPPGVTGLWQISGRNNTTYELRTRIDDYYVRNWSLSLDVFILLRTLKTIVLSEGAY